MKKPVHISFDLETWGKRAGFDIRSIGACVIDIDNQIVGNPAPAIAMGDHPVTYEFYTACENPFNTEYPEQFFKSKSPRELDKLGGDYRKYNLKRDPTTIDWWYDKMLPEAQNAFDNPVELREALMLFTRWLRSHGVDAEDEHSLRLYSHGGSFDTPILEAMFYAVGLPVPWHYRTPRDTRTLYDSAGFYDHSALMKIVHTGIQHHALDDSINQGKAILEAMLLLRHYIPQPSEG